MKRIKHSNQQWSSDINLVEMENFKKEMAKYPINEDLIKFLEGHLRTFGDINKKLVCLYFVKKVLPYLKREVDTAHALAFEEEHRNDREFFDPMKWLDKEIEFWSSIKALEPSKETSQSIVEAKRGLGKQWLTREEMMDMLRISRTTLNRRIAEGMPCHQKGSAVFFNLEEVSQWLKEDDAA